MAEIKSLKIDCSWKGLTRPGDATDHFIMDPLPPFTPDVGAFNLVNAFWLSEMSRLIYRRNTGEAGVNACGPSRNTILAAVGLRETLFLNRQETQCALLRTVHPSPHPFAVLVFRGTTGLRNWFLDIDVRPERIAPRTVAHHGFMDAFGQVWQSLKPHMEQLAEPLFITGHSMGGALAQLAAWHHSPRAVYSFGAPRVGDAGFARHMTSIPIYRLVNGRDLVPNLPPSTRLLSFRAAGRLVHIDRKGRICEIEPNDEPANCFESGRLSMSALGKRWFNPPGFLVDHAPINYSAKIQKSLQAGKTATMTSDQTTTSDLKNDRLRSAARPIR